MEITYHVKKTQEKIGDLLVQLECLENLDETIDQVFKVLEQNGNPQALEELCPYFGVIWPAARGLAEYLADLPPPHLVGKRVLELGCGLALPSLVAAKRGGKVVATDFHPEVQRFFSRNVELNSVQNLQYLQINWEKESPSFQPFDWVIGSDILYERRFAHPLAQVFSKVLKPGGVAILTDPGRPYLQDFVDEMKKLGFRYRTDIRKVPHGSKLQEVFILSFERELAAGQPSV